MLRPYRVQKRIPGTFEWREAIPDEHGWRGTSRPHSPRFTNKRQAVAFAKHINQNGEARVRHMPTGRTLFTKGLGTRL